MPSPGEPGCRIGLAVGFLLLVFLPGPQPASAQTAQMQAIAREFRNDREALERYVWTSHTVIRVDGEVLHDARALVGYGPGGELQTEALESEAAEGTARRKPSRQQKKLSRVVDDLQEIVDSYLDLGYRELRDAFASGHAWDGRGEHTGETRIQSRNVINQGDRLDVWAAAISRRLVLLQVLTSNQGEPVHLAVQYRELPDGPSYPALTTVETEVKEKKVVIRTETSDYRLRSEP